jgi:arylsulfatase A-like enzyme
LKNLFFTCACFVLFSCANEKVAQKQYKTENIVVLVVDGPRYSETWGDANHSYVPNLDTLLAPKGIMYTSFFNNGVTYTTPGHTSITTGIYQNIDNYGNELPKNPSFLQQWLKYTNKSANTAWIVASKDKLEVLANTSDLKWKNSYMPSTNCGINGTGVGSGYRSDSLTHIEVMNVLNTYHPNLLFVNYKEPDASGHAANWQGYLNGIKACDDYVKQVWEFIQSDPMYKDKTALFITNDHGRHLNGINDGFVSHGDNCEGCRHIYLYAFGPDFKQNVIETQQRELIDINATILELLGLDEQLSDGEVMTELFVN